MAAVPDKKSPRAPAVRQVPPLAPEPEGGPPAGVERRRSTGLRRAADVALLNATSAGMSLVKAHRTHGHLDAKLDPLGTKPPGDPALEPENLGLTPELMALVPASALRVYVPGDTLAEVLPELRRVYRGTIAFEIEHLSDHDERVWLREAIESRSFWIDNEPEEDRKLLIRLLRVEGLEAYLRRTFLGAKQFSIEGLEMMILMLDEAVALAARDGISNAVFGMAHRGRLNVLAHVLRRPYAKIIAEFEGERTPDVDIDLPAGGQGDVKYHLGAQTTRDVDVGGGERREIKLSLLPNPSHLEFINPVVVGRTRALQTVRGPLSTVDVDVRRALAVQIHGDAAFPGQGVVAETFNLQNLPGYRVGGSLHLIANNQLGFTTGQIDARSTRYASDLAKGFDAPIIHVNADDLRACRTAIRLAMAFRSRFGRDVVIDLVGYRRWGHNEGDEPTYTQPRLYEAIREHPSVATLYARRLVAQGTVSEADVEEMRERIARRLQEEHASVRAGRRSRPRRTGLPEASRHAVRTGVDAERLRDLGEQLLSVPAGFSVHPKLQTQLDRRKAGLEPGGRVDWGHAESLALASLLLDGTAVRLTGQDTERGTFSHRHAVLHDVETGALHTPLQHLRDARAGIELRNSPLSENACLGFEYGYAVTSPDALVLWEAQFGDFINGAQVIVDQFIMAGASKWGQRSRLTLLLPHGYEGNGPEHSYARLDHFLKLAAEDNIRVVNPTTAAQYFHMLREQALTPVRRPLVVMTPKSLLRLKDATSSIEELTTGGFRPIIDDASVEDWKEDIARLVLCSGKVYHDIQRHPRRSEADEVAVARIERLYPFPTEELGALVASYPNLESVVWVQEEPMNLGAFRAIRHRLVSTLPDSMVLEYEGRPWRSSPAEGYTVAHEQEQERIVRAALWLEPAATTA
jgi:2-oxoglutarate dehydrogenase E1 component